MIGAAAILALTQTFVPPAIPDEFLDGDTYWFHLCSSQNGQLAYSLIDHDSTPFQWQAERRGPASQRIYNEVLMVLPDGELEYLFEFRTEGDWNCVISRFDIMELPSDGIFSDE